MPIGRSHTESSTFVLDGRVIIAGGQIDNYQATANVVEYDPASDTWDMLPSLPRPLEGVIVQPLGGRLFATGGYIGNNSVASVASYSSNRFTGPANYSTGFVRRIVLPIAGGSLLLLGSMLAVVASRRERILRAKK